MKLCFPKIECSNSTGHSLTKKARLRLLLNKDRKNREGRPAHQLLLLPALTPLNNHNDLLQLKALARRISFPRLLRLSFQELHMSPTSRPLHNLASRRVLRPRLRRKCNLRLLCLLPQEVLGIDLKCRVTSGDHHQAQVRRVRTPSVDLNRLKGKRQHKDKLDLATSFRILKGSQKCQAGHRTVKLLPLALLLAITTITIIDTACQILAMPSRPSSRNLAGWKVNYPRSQAGHLLLLLLILLQLYTALHLYMDLMQQRQGISRGSEAI
jgi:hypothetical protein